jgi:lysylphosphatidylglycerol synthetase-like protein (DUF2156 family)
MELLGGIFQLLGSMLESEAAQSIGFLISTSLVVASWVALALFNLTLNEELSLLDGRIPYHNYFLPSFFAACITLVGVVLGVFLMLWHDHPSPDTLNGVCTVST